MKEFPILWQRLVSAEGETCVRCQATHDEMLRALAQLRTALRPMGLEPRLEVRALDQATFRANPAESNRIWIAGRPMEEWLEAGVGSSPCCSVCAGAECRTVTVGGTAYESIPADLFLRAALRAAAQFGGQA